MKFSSVKDVSCNVQSAVSCSFSVHCVNFECMDFELAGDVVCVFCVCTFLLACCEDSKLM